MAKYEWLTQGGHAYVERFAGGFQSNVPGDLIVDEVLRLAERDRKRREGTEDILSQLAADSRDRFVLTCVERIRALLKEE